MESISRLEGGHIYMSKNLGNESCNTGESPIIRLLVPPDIFFFHRNSCHQNKFILQCFPCCVGDCIFNEIHHLFGVDVLTPRIFDAETF